MRVDLFELLDGLFKGVVYFFYNLFETVYNILRRPVRGRCGSTRRTAIRD